MKWFQVRVDWSSAVTWVSWFLFWEFWVVNVSGGFRLWGFGGCMGLGSFGRGLVGWGGVWWLF